MDNLLARQPGAILIKSAPSRRLNRDSLASAVSPRAASSYYSSKVSRGGASCLPATRIGTAKKSPEWQQS
jgi:hypothetical protein